MRNAIFLKKCLQLILLITDYLFEMGTDWFRFKVKNNIDSCLLELLIEQQAITYQSIFARSPYDRDCKFYRRDWELLQKVNLESYCKASKQLKQLLDFPEWNEEKQCAEDIFDLDVGMRAYAIQCEPNFPPLWRIRSMKTYLPKDLEAQLLTWKQWIEQVKAGDKDDYLRKLHLYNTIETMNEHLSELKGNAIASLTRNNNWIKKTALIEVRNIILQLPESIYIDYHLDPQEEPPYKLEDFNCKYQETFASLNKLIELTKTWNSNVRGDWKVRYSRKDYDFTLDEFKGFDEVWLYQFFQWAKHCLENDFGLYLDY